MGIEKIDKNFKTDGCVTKEDVVWMDVREAPFDIYGLYDAKNQPRFCRIAPEIGDQVNDGVAVLNYHTSGGRIKFKTNSPYIALRAEFKIKFMSHMPLSGSSGFDLYTCNGGDYRFVRAFRPGDIKANCFESERDLDGKLNDFVLSLPLYNTLDKLYIGIKKGSVIEKGRDYTFNTPIGYYGSSITQGGCASRPSTAYQAFISRRLDANFINFGFAGSGKGEPLIAEYIAKQDMCAFVLDYDYNAPSTQHLRDTHLPFYKTIRAAHPDMPIIMISAPNYYSKERIEVIKDTYNYAVAHGDKNVSFLCGYDIIGDDCRDACFVDGCHPNDLGFYRMAKAIGDELEVYLYKNAKK